MALRHRELGGLAVAAQLHAVFAPAGERAARRRRVQVRRRAGDGDQLLAAGGLHRRQAAQQGGRVGVRRAVENVPRGALLHDFAGVHHRHAVREVRHHAEVVGNQDNRRAGLVADFLHQLHNLRLDGHVQRGGRLVGNQQFRVAGERHRNHGALAHPAGKLVRVLARPLLRVGDLHHLQQADRLFAALPAAQVLVLLQGLGQLLADLFGRVQAGHRVLENHAHQLAADALHLLFARGDNVPAAQVDFAVFDAGGRHGVQLHHRLGGHALAAAAFADDGQRLARVHVQAHAAHGVHLARVGVERHLQVLNVQYPFHPDDYLLSLGSKASRIWSPSRLKASMVMLMNTAG